MVWEQEEVGAPGKILLCMCGLDVWLFLLYFWWFCAVILFFNNEQNLNSETLSSTSGNFLDSL